MEAVLFLGMILAAAALLSPLRFSDVPTGGAGALPPAAPAPPAAAAPVPAPSPSPAAPAGVAQPQPVAETPLSLDSPLVFTGPDGVDVNTTYGELIDDHNKMKELDGIDIGQAKDVMAAMGNDPEAQRRLLQSQLKHLEEGVIPEGQVTPEVVALQERLTAMEGKLTRTERLVNTVEDQELNTYVKTLLTNPKVAEQIPWLASQPDVGIAMIVNNIKQLRAQAKTVGQDISNRTDLLGDCVRRAEATVKAIASQYGGALAAPAADPAAVAVVAASHPGDVLPGSMIAKARVTPQDLLDRRIAGMSPNAAVPQPGVPGQTVLSGQVPEAGGTPGGHVAPAGPPPDQKFNGMGLLERMKSQIVQSGSQQ